MRQRARDNPRARDRQSAHRRGSTCRRIAGQLRSTTHRASQPPVPDALALRGQSRWHMPFHVSHRSGSDDHRSGSLQRTIAWNDT